MTDAAALEDSLADVEVRASELVFDGVVWGVRRDVFDYNGEDITREYLDHTGAVAVFALDDDDRVLLIKQYRHPVGMTSLQNFNNRVLAAASADFIAPGGPAYEQSPPVSAGHQVSILDMDHMVPCTGVNDARWPWKAFTRGHNLWYIYCQQYGKPNVSETTVMERMGQAGSYANRMNLGDAAPETDPSRCSTGYCLMGRDFVLGFVPEGGAIALDLSAAGTWSVEWFEPASGNTRIAPSVRNGLRTLTAPFPDDAVVFLVRNAPPASGE